MDVRRQERTRLIYHLRVFDAKTETLLGQLVDITPDGLMVIGEHPIRLDRTFSLRMDLPHNVMDERHLTFSAESKWCRLDSTGEFYSMGFRLSRISAKGLGVVDRLVRDFYEEEGDPALSDGEGPSR